MGLYAHENIAVQLFAALQAEWNWDENQAFMPSDNILDTNTTS